MKTLFIMVVLAMFFMGCAAMPGPLPDEPNIKAMLMESAHGPVVIMPAGDFMAWFEYVEALKKALEGRKYK